MTSTCELLPVEHGFIAGRRSAASTGPALASILRKDGVRYVLVTPVEKVGRVDDVPFLAVE